MYTINTQLVYFKYSLDYKKLLVNIKWFKLYRTGHVNLQALSFNKEEMDQFKSFIDEHRLNFPGGQFIESSTIDGFTIPLVKEFPKTSLPFYLILSKKSMLNLSENNFQIADIVLMDENYESIIDYTLDFETIGKIEIYKELKI